MPMKTSKAVVHVASTLLRRNWYGTELTSCVVVRPAGKERDTTAYVVNQVKFSGPSEMVFDAKPRGPAAADKGLVPNEHGFVGGLPGFDGAILVYLEANEADIHVQVKPGESFVPFGDFKKAVEVKRIAVPTLDPRLEVNC